MGIWHFVVEWRMIDLKHLSISAQLHKISQITWVLHKPCLSSPWKFRWEWSASKWKASPIRYFLIRLWTARGCGYGLWPIKCHQRPKTNKWNCKNYKRLKVDSRSYQILLFTEFSILNLFPNRFPPTISSSSRRPPSRAPPTIHTLFHRIVRSSSPDTYEHSMGDQEKNVSPFWWQILASRTCYNFQGKVTNWNAEWLSILSLCRCT